MTFTLPFRIASPDAPLLVVRAEVNGQGPFDFILDTGNGAPVEAIISPSLQHKLGLTAADGPFPIVRLDALHLGDWRHEHVQAGVVEAIDHIAAQIGVELVGNVGFHLLRHWPIEIDYARSEVRLGHADGSPADAGSPFDTGPGGAFVLLAARVNDRGPYRFLVDTGASTTAIAPRVARELGLSGTPAEALGVMGKLAAESFVLDRLEVAGRVVTDLEAGSIDVFDYTSQAAGTTVDGILGYTFLRQFRVVLDYPNRRIGFVPSKR